MRTLGVTHELHDADTRYLVATERAPFCHCARAREPVGLQEIAVLRIAADFPEYAVDRRATGAIACIERQANHGFQVDGESRAPAVCGIVQPPNARDDRARRAQIDPMHRERVGFGATGRGAVTALEAMGIADVSVLTRRDAAAVAGKIHSMRLVTYERDPDSPERTLELDSEHESVAEFLSEHDVVVNCVLQDTDAPLILISGEELERFSRGTLFVDVSADVGMGFGWSRPTTFEEPMFTVGDGMRCYAVDHSPSLLWDSATWEVSQAFIPHLAAVMGGSEAWDSDPTVGPAIEIRNGVIQNPKILSFQGRSAEFPHTKG